MRKDGDSAQIKNDGGSLQKHCERRIVGFWWHAWQVFSLFLKTSNCRECNCSESTQSPSSNPFHLTHSRFLLIPYLNHYCSNSGPSDLILPTTETENRSFSSSTTASWRFKDMPQQRNVVFWAKRYQFTPSCHRLCFSDVNALCWALPRTPCLSWNTPRRTAHSTPAALGQSSAEQTYFFTCLMDCIPIYYPL